MRIGVVGAGILGLSLAHKLAKLGHSVTVLEAAPEIGGLTAAHDYGPFVWDRFYHCILPTDSELIGLVDELGLGGDLRWSDTGTGYYANNRFFDMNGNADFLRFPLLGIADKARMGATVLWATRFADPWELYRVTAAEWITRWCGRAGYEGFWRPLLRAKFGPFHDQVAAVFIWATLTRLMGARANVRSQEKMGYCIGGYAKILGRLREVIEQRGGAIHTSCPVTEIRRADDGAGVVVQWDAGAAAATKSERFDQLFFTGPTRLAERVVQGDLRVNVDEVARSFPTGSTFLGVACLVLVLKKPLTRYYVLNIADERVALTGLIEMTNLVDRSQTQGLSLVYLPQYMAADDPRFDQPEEELAATMLERGIHELFPAFDDRDIVYGRIHKARWVQPLPLVRASGGPDPRLFPRIARPLTVLNTSMLTCATLNNNEVVGLVNRFVRESLVAL